MLDNMTCVSALLAVLYGACFGLAEVKVYESSALYFVVGIKMQLFQRLGLHTGSILLRLNGRSFTKIAAVLDSKPVGKRMTVQVRDELCMYEFDDNLKC